MLQSSQALGHIVSFSFELSFHSTPLSLLHVFFLLSTVILKKEGNGLLENEYNNT